MTPASANSTSRGHGIPIVCFSHLAWDENLFQRPQHIMSGLARLGHPVIYFACVGRQVHTQSPHSGPLPDSPNVSVYTLPYSPQATKLAKVRRWTAALTVARILKKNHIQDPILWFYHPSLFSLGYSHADSAIVYDIMDHFPSFENSGDELYFDELALLAESDLVFAGGKSLAQHARQMLEQLASDLAAENQSKPKMPQSPPANLPPVVCLPSGVDLEHFTQSPPQSTTASYPRPIFGYFGAIDERIDWPLLCALASNTEGTVILAGPILKEPPPNLPDNLRCIGPTKYEALPTLLATFDVALIPFRITPLTKYVSPTKTPEYLAGGKPVISTAIPDVLTDYGDIVSVCGDENDFVQTCLKTANNPPNPTHLTAQAAQRAKTWHDTVDEMERHLSKAISPGVRR